MASLDDLLGGLWDDYATMNPHALKVREQLEARGERVVNDHIALRTFDDPRVNVQVLSKAFVELGYQPGEAYEFPAKKLRARHFEHPDKGRPLVFISELKLAEMSSSLREAVGALIDQIPEGLTDRWDLPVAGRPWAVDFTTYQKLADESEYAGWLAAHGFRANHFTVLVNELSTFETLGDLNEFLKAAGFALNESGGTIKGSPAELLEQSSTLAESVEVAFTDGRKSVPGCYYEFARRYPLPDGGLFRGFIAKSADKIFESTDRRQ